MTALDNHITNPVTLREVRMMRRLSVLWLTAASVLVGTLLPTIILIYDWSWSEILRERIANRLAASLCALHGLMALLGWGYAGFFSSWDQQSPQKEFTFHGRLEAQSLLQGRRRAAWLLLGWCHLFTLPALIWLAFLGNDMTLQMVSKLAFILAALLAIEMSLCTIGLGTIGFLPMIFLPVIALGAVDLTVQDQTLSNLFAHFFLNDKLAHEYLTRAEALPWEAWLFAGLLTTGLVALFQAIARFGLEPPRSNRECRIRVVSTIIWAVTSLFAWHCTVKFGSWKFMYAWTFLNCGLALLGMLPVVLAIDPLPNRVRRQIPTGGIRKWLAHPFYSGPDSSLIWGIALVILTLLPSTIRIAFFDIPPEERHGEILFSYLIGFLLIVGILLKMPALLQNTGPKDSRSTIQMKFFRFAVFTAAIVVGVWLVAASLEEHGRLKLEEIPFLAEILITAFVLFVTIQVWQSRRWFVQRWKEFTPVDG